MKNIESDAVRVIGISGSLRGKSISRMAVEIALKGAAEVGAETRMLDLRQYHLTFSEEEWETKVPSANVVQMRQDVKQAHGLILGTPEYHGSYSGILKYALDLMRFEEIEGKMIGLVGVSGGKMGATDALTSLRAVGRALHAWVVPEQVSISEAWRQFETDGRIRDLRLEGALKDVGRQVARFAYLHNSEQAREFLRAWESAPPNPGGQR